MVRANALEPWTPRAVGMAPPRTRRAGTATAKPRCRRTRDKMPKLPRDLSHDDLVWVRRREAWALEREGARHAIMSKADNEVSIPRHAKPKTGAIAAILRQAEISRERLERLR